MHVFKAYIESIRGRSISQTSDLLPLFALPYVPQPERHNSFRELFAVCAHRSLPSLVVTPTAFLQEEWPEEVRKKVSTFLDTTLTRRSAQPDLAEVLQNGERASHVLIQLSNENEELKFRNRETNQQLKHLSSDYFNLISKHRSRESHIHFLALNRRFADITMELVETLQQAVVGKTITNDYIDNVCARVLLARTQGSLSLNMEPSSLR